MLHTSSDTPLSQSYQPQVHSVLDWQSTNNNNINNNNVIHVDSLVNS